MQTSETIEKMKEEMESARKSRDTEDIMDANIHEPIGYIFMRFFNRLGFSPNAVTILSGLVGIAGGVLFFYQDFLLNLIGVVLSILAIILDCTDGQLARLTGKTSEIGRFLDGSATIVICAVQYLAIGFRMMNENIFFSSTRVWGPWCWLMIVPCALIFHSGQSRMADYFRNLHLLFEVGNKGCELDDSKELKAQYQAEKKEHRFSWKLFYLWWYISYTVGQEKTTPVLQRFFALFGRDSSRYPAQMRKDFLKSSRKYIQLTNLLTINFRAYSLFLLLLLGIHDWYFPLLALLEVLNGFMITRYEGIARSLIGTYGSHGDHQ